MAQTVLWQQRYFDKLLEADLKVDRLIPFF